MGKFEKFIVATGFLGISYYATNLYLKPSQDYN